MAGPREIAVIIATMTYERPVLRSSARTTRTGRSLAVRRLESGKTTRATSPRLQPGPRGVVVIIDVHLRTIPVRGERREPGSQLSRMRLVDPVRPEIDAAWLQEGHQNRHLLAYVVRPLGQLDLAFPGRRLRSSSTCPGMVPPCPAESSPAGPFALCGRPGWGGGSSRPFVLNLRVCGVSGSLGPWID